jgi:hypothetical protein
MLIAVGGELPGTTDCPRKLTAEAYHHRAKGEDKPAGDLGTGLASGCHPGRAAVQHPAKEDPEAEPGGPRDAADRPAVRARNNVSL